MKLMSDIERRELKYFIPYKLISPIREFISPFMELDPYSAERKNHEYTIRSIYFDSDQFDFYYEKLDGIKIRKKLRVRTYNEVDSTSCFFFEIKRRFENRIFKERIKGNIDSLEQVCIQQQMPNESIFDSQNSKNSLGRFIYNLKLKSLRPVLLVIYEREAFIGAINPEIRLTFDKDVRISLFPDFKDNFEDTRPQFVTNERCVLELKFNSFMPKWMRTLVGVFNLRAQSISKYCMGIDCCPNK